MIVKSVNLETVCGPTSALPKNGRPEIAFAGRSNVGKSSLLNVLINRKAYARTSSQPGKTQTINFYNINDALYFVDLPGYGYAKASRAERERWGSMVNRYLESSAQLKCVIMLVDIRHDPTESDRQMYDWIVASGCEPVVVATKLDKIKRSQTAKQIKAMRTVLGAGSDIKVIPFSAVTRQGREEIWKIIDETAG